MYLVRIQTTEGHSFKVLIELIQKYIQDGSFSIDEKGLRLTGIDNKKRKLIHVDLPAENFTPFECKKNIQIGVNMMHFYRMLKCIKKKDNTLTLYILEREPLKLYICVNQGGENKNKGIISCINITLVRELTIHEEVTGYGRAIVVPSKEFQKIKQLGKISPSMSITTKGKNISLSCGREGLYSNSVTLGELTEENCEEEISEEYTHTYPSDHILDLVKLGSISSNVHIHTSYSLPLYIKMKCGTLGNVHLRIKSDEFIKEEQEDE